MGQLAGEMEEAVRIELAERLGASAAPPPSLARSLASDSIAIARPILEGAPQLSEADLLHVARTRGQDHLRAISQRPVVPRPGVGRHRPARRRHHPGRAAAQRGRGAVARGPRGGGRPRGGQSGAARGGDRPQGHAHGPAQRDVLRGRGAPARPDHGAQRQCRSGHPGSRAEGRPQPRRRRRRRPAGRLPGGGQRDRGPQAARRDHAQALVAMLRASKTSQFLVALAELADIDFTPPARSSSAASWTPCRWSARRRTSTAPCS